MGNEGTYNSGWIKFKSTPTWVPFGYRLVEKFSSALTLGEAAEHILGYFNPPYPSAASQVHNTGCLPIM